MDLFKKRIEKNFEKYFDDYFNLVYRRVYYLMANSTVAEDIAQETFLKLYTKPPENADNIKGWLLKVATNLAINSMKSSSCRNKREEEDCLQHLGASIVNVEDAVLKSIESEAVLAILSEMEWRDRSILYLRYSGMAYDEIAQAVGVEKNAVGVLLSRARNKFLKRYTSLHEI